jgi:triphosphoribosyl-dephospho-CoA synthetase
MADGDAWSKAIRMGASAQRELADGRPDDAIVTLREAIRIYPPHADPLAISLRYLLTGTLTDLARGRRSLELAREASRWASQVLQEDDGYRDVREQMKALSQLERELRHDGHTEGSGI